MKALEMFLKLQEGIKEIENKTYWSKIERKGISLFVDEAIAELKEIENKKDIEK